jgi:hypothetical protein
MQRMGYIKNWSTPGHKAYKRLFEGELTVSNVEALDVLFMDAGKGSCRQQRRLKATPYVAMLCFYRL